MKNFNPKDNGVKMPFDDIDFINKWQEWLQYRKERKLANYVPTGLKRTFTKLFNDSGGNPAVAIQMIDQAMALSWQGIYPLKTQSNGNQQKTPVTNDDLAASLHRNFSNQ